jgi:putative ABC transport system ATP-binding protein
VSLSRALVNNPRLLLADEPTGALDTTTSDEIMELFGALNLEGNTIVLVTHEMDIARHARRRILLRDGAIVEDTRRTLLDLPAHAEAMP